MSLSRLSLPFFGGVVGFIPSRSINPFSLSLSPPLFRSNQKKKKTSKTKRRKAEEQEGTGKGHTTRDIASNKKR
jgi:hypothetical protein